jgi:hypothetical protein
MGRQWLNAAPDGSQPPEQHAVIITSPHNLNCGETRLSYDGVHFSFQFSARAVLI